MDTTTDRSALEGKLIPELQQIAQRLGIEGSQKLRKAGLIDAIVEHGSSDGATTNGPSAAVNASDGGVATVETGSRERAPSTDGGSNGQRHDNDDDDDRSTEGERDAGNDRPRGESDRGDRQPNDRQPSDRSQSNRPRNDRSQGDRQGGDRSQGGRPQGDRPRGDAPQGDRPRGDDQGGRTDSGDDRGEPRGDRRGRPSREERRRVREERRLREEQERARGTPERAGAHRDPGHPPRGLRIPPDLRLPAGARGHLRLALAGAPVLTAQGRHGGRTGPPSEGQREVLRAARDRQRQRDGRRGRARASELRQADPALP